MKKKLAKILHFANRRQGKKGDEFYRVKTHLLKKYGKKIGKEYEYRSCGECV